MLRRIILVSLRYALNLQKLIAGGPNKNGGWKNFQKLISRGRQLGTIEYTVISLYKYDTTLL